MTTNSWGYAPMDPTVSRLIEEAFAVVHDIDQRLQSLKFGLVQAAPHLGSLVGNRELAFGTMGRSNIMSIPYATPYGVLPSHIGARGFESFGSPVSLGPYGTPVTGTPYGTHVPTMPYGAPITSPWNTPSAVVSPSFGIGHSFRPF